MHNNANMRFLMHKRAVASVRAYVIFMHTEQRISKNIIPAYFVVSIDIER